MLAMASMASAQYQMERTVVSSGGGDAAGGLYTGTFTMGQPVAGGPLLGAPDWEYAGFWAPPEFVPTAATVSLSGRVVTAHGHGIYRAVVILTDIHGTSRKWITNSFGFYRFANIRSGESYILSVTAKQYIFENPTQFVSAMDDVTGLDFRAAALSP